MPKIKIQNISINNEQQFGAEILKYYQDGDSGTKGVRIRSLIEVGFAIRKISPTLFQVVNGMSTEGRDISPEKLTQLIHILCSDEQSNAVGVVVSPMSEPEKPTAAKPKGGLNEL